MRWNPVFRMDMCGPKYGRQEPVLWMNMCGSRHGLLNQVFEYVSSKNMRWNPVFRMNMQVHKHNVMVSNFYYEYLSSETWKIEPSI